MKKELIKEIIRNFHKSLLPPTKLRNIKIPLHSEKIITLAGARRSGKTCTLINCMKELIAHDVPVEKILYFNFEDERINLQKDEADLLIQGYRELYPDINISECFFFFDEIQNLVEWEKFIRRIYDTTTYSIFITGSNSKLLSKEIATALRGRTVTYEIFPLSFKEYLQFNNVEIDLYHSRSKARIVNLLERFLIEGGFPEIMKYDDSAFKTKVLQEYFDVMLYRDLVERYAITHLSVLKYFARRLIESIGSSFSINKIYNDLKSQGAKIGKNSLYDYMEYVNAIYLCFPVRKYIPSVIKQEFTDKKIYMIDNGLLNATTFKYSNDRGKLLENFVHGEFIKRGYNIYFFKEKKECDFIIIDKSSVRSAFQVCYNIADKATLHREIAGLQEVCKRFDLKEGIILTYSEEDKLKVDNLSIVIIPAYKYFLSLEE